MACRRMQSRIALNVWNYMHVQLFLSLNPGAVQTEGERKLSTFGGYKIVLLPTGGGGA